MLSQNDAPVAEVCVVTVGFELDQRFALHCLQLNGDPTELAAAQRPIVVKELLLTVERLNHNANEQLHKQHADEDDEHHCVEDHYRTIVHLRLVVGFHGVN